MYSVVVVVVLVRAYSLVFKMLAIYFGLRPFGTGRTDRAVQYGTNLQGKSQSGVLPSFPDRSPVRRYLNRHC